MNDFDIAKLAADKLAKEYKEKSDALQAFDKLGKTELGLTPDHVKASPEWKQAKADYENAFQAFRNYNQWYTKAFKKELAEQRRNKYK